MRPLSPSLARMIVGKRRFFALFLIALLVCNLFVIKVAANGGDKDKKDTSAGEPGVEAAKKNVEDPKKPVDSADPSNTTSSKFVSVVGDHKIAVGAVVGVAVIGCATYYFFGSSGSGSSN